MTTNHWTVWTDGSCVHARDKGRGSGGWAAIVEHDSDGDVYRGRETDVTSNRMELVAAREGLRATNKGAQVTLRTDSTTLVIIQQWADKGCPPRRSNADMDLWYQLRTLFHERTVTIELISRGDRDLVHRRCHMIANAEARALHRGAPPPKLLPLASLKPQQRPYILGQA
jgi:ribonuclease HI